MFVQVLQLQKRASYEYRFIQDKYAICADAKIFAIADGTTQSFNSEEWAALITKTFVENPEFLPENLLKRFKETASIFKSLPFSYSTNFAAASLEKAKQRNGASSTFLGLKLSSENVAEIISCGDSNLFVVDVNHSITSIPYSNLDSLDQNSCFLNTEAITRDEIENEYFYTDKFHTKDVAQIILATDALSRLMLTKPAVVSEFCKIRQFDQLLEFCTFYWDKKDLQEDDITAIIINLKQNKPTQLILPSATFAFPKEEERPFSPAAISADYNLTPMQINDINDKLNNISKELFILKEKQQKTQALVILITSMILLAALFFSFTRFGIPFIQQLKADSKKEKTKDNDINRPRRTTANKRDTVQMSPKTTRESRTTRADSNYSKVSK